MTVQAMALGLHVRQFRTFDSEGIAADFGVPAHWEATTLSAVGRAPSAPPPTTSSRGRRSDLRWPTHRGSSALQDRCRGLTPRRGQW